jgi:NADPH:quinone reductase-like Zn-dependent oxidoreductase
VLRLHEVTTFCVRGGEVLIRQYASSLYTLDTSTNQRVIVFPSETWETPQTKKHEIAGGDFTGRVETVGRDIKQFRSGDEVFAGSFTGNGLGGFAEFACAGETCHIRGGSSHACSMDRCPFGVLVISVRSGAGRRF